MGKTRMQQTEGRRQNETGKIRRTKFWNTGILEYWNNGESRKAEGYWILDTRCW
jgi:hypothetical protein